MNFNQLLELTESHTKQTNEQKRKKIVCRHWMRNSCKLGEKCNYLHVYDEKNLPVCNFFVRDGYCPKGDECDFRHPDGSDSDRRQPECPYFEMGFCKLGVHCPLLHVKTVICPDFALGFCPKGPTCTKKHVKGVSLNKVTSLGNLANYPHSEDWVDFTTAKRPGFPDNHHIIRCHKCGERGHKSTFCQEPKMDKDDLIKLLSQDQDNRVSAVTCNYCQKQGHYASVCPQKQNDRRQKREKEASANQAPMSKRVDDLIALVKQDAPHNGGYKRFKHDPWSSTSNR